MTTYENDGSRRTFLKLASLTALAAAATGGGAALVSRLQRPAVISTAPPAYPTIATVNEPLTQPVVAQPVIANNDDLLARLGNAEAENLQLRAQVDSLQRELEAALAGDQQSRAARDSLALELDGAHQQIGVLGGLVALYEQLDGVDVGAVVENGLASVGEKITELLEGTPGLSAGLDNGQLALSDIEAHIPLLDNGRQWLGAQADKVQGVYGNVELWLQQAVDRVGDFLHMLSEWFEGLRKWLPFGAGEKAANVMSAMTALLAEVPGTLAGLDTNIAQPLDVWLARIDGEPALTQRLVKPMRDEVIARARTTVDQAHQVGTLYEEQLAAPLRSTVGNRQALQQAIAEYRQQHQM